MRGDVLLQQQDAIASSSNCCAPGEWWTRGSRTTNNDKGEVEADLAKTLNDLSVQEREKVFEEIHGVAQSQEETPEFLEKALADFDLAISQIFKRKRRALDRAIFLKPSLQTDDDFKLLFLRADCFNAAKAANRMARYYEKKLVLFGEEKLVKPITHEDVTEEEMELGFRLLGMLMPQKDQSGRPMYIAFPNTFNLKASPENLLRGIWYQAMVILTSDEAASKKGLCKIVYAPGNAFNAESIPKIAQNSWQAGGAFNCLPLRYNSYHFCYSNPAIQMLLGGIQQGMGKQMRVRLRTHFGSPVEIQYSLLTFGIDCSEVILTYDESRRDFPVDLLDTNFSKRQAQVECQQEERRLDQEAVSGLILYPNPNDVLIGRGLFFASHSGNRRYHHVVESNLEKYNACNNRFQKTAISTEIVKKIQASGGRFLIPTKGGWEVVEDTVAREKIAIAFRSFKKRAK